MMLKLAFASLAAILSCTSSIATTIPPKENNPRKSSSTYSKMLQMPNNIPTDSQLGQRLLSHARRLDGDEDEEDEEEDEESEDESEDEDKEFDYSNFMWINKYSLKFQGCHHMTQWNANNDEDNDVKIMTRRLVRFRLCETGRCSDTAARGCKKGYGDYVIDLNVFLESYLEYQQRKKEYENDDYVEEDEEDDLAKYMECERLEIEDDEEEEGDRRRRMEDKEEDEYFVGPYCAEKGGGIFLGLFTDDACTNFADNDAGKDTYYALTNNILPYSSESIVSMDCVNCAALGNVYGDDYYVGDQCGAPYTSSGKCEVHLSDSVVGRNMQNNAACHYMEGIHIASEEGLVIVRKRASGVANFFIFLFSCSFGFFVYYAHLLHKKLRMKRSMSTGQNQNDKKSAFFR